jgi:hypothetical protein
MPDSDQSASPATDTAPTKSLAAHLARGAVGFGLIGAAFALTPTVGPAALLLAPPGAVALGGCPTCWISGLVETVSAGRLQRTCNDSGCELHSRADHYHDDAASPPASATHRTLPHAGH